VLLDIAYQYDHGSLSNYYVIGGIIYNRQVRDLGLLEIVQHSEVKNEIENLMQKEAPS